MAASPTPPARYDAKAFHAKCQEMFREYSGWRDIERLIKATMQDAINGDPAARSLVWPYLFGAKPQSPLINVEGDLNVNQQAVIWGIAWKPPELEGQAPQLIESKITTPDIPQSYTSETSET